MSASFSAPYSVTNRDNGDRDEAGRFRKGCAGGPGNPNFRNLAARRRALIEAVSPEDVAAVGRQLLQQALAGDTVASELLLRYVVGRAVPAVDADQADLDELRLLLQSPDAEITCTRGQVAPALATAEVLKHQIRTAEQLLEALVERAQELRRELQSRAGPDDWLELEELARAAGLDGGDEGEDEGGDDAADD
jgi:hypothetical protein